MARAEVKSADMYKFSRTSGMNNCQADMLTYPCQYAGVHSHNLRQTFHGFCPYSNGALPKDTQDLLGVGGINTHQPMIRQTALFQSVSQSTVLVIHLLIMVSYFV